MADMKLLLNFNGDDGTTVTKDGSVYKHPITFVDDAHVDTAQKKFGVSSLLVDGDKDRCSVPDSSDWDIVGDASDWTIDVFMKTSNPLGPNGSNHFFLSHRENANNRWIFNHNTSDVLAFTVLSGGASVVALSGGSIGDDDWHHVTLCKVATEYGIYLDGTQTAYVDDASTDAFDGSLIIGNVSAGASTGWNGWIDSLRITKSNLFGAAPNSTPNDTIVVPTAEPYVTSIFFGDILTKNIIGNMQFNISGNTLMLKNNQLIDVSTGTAIYALDDNYMKLI